ARIRLTCPDPRRMVSLVEPHRAGRHRARSLRIQVAGSPATGDRGWSGRRTTTTIRFRLGAAITTSVVDDRYETDRPSGRTPGHLGRRLTAAAEDPGTVGPEELTGASRPVTRGHHCFRSGPLPGRDDPPTHQPGMGHWT